MIDMNIHTLGQVVTALRLSQKLCEKVATDRHGGRPDSLEVQTRNAVKKALSGLEDEAGLGSVPVADGAVRASARPG